MTVRENIVTAAEISARAQRRSRREAAACADDVLARVGLQPVAERRTDALPTGQARLVELARAMAARPKVLLLDEPASGLDDAATDRLADVLEDIAADEVSILLVEHDIDLVMRLCSTIYVLSFGEVIASGSPTAVRDDPRVRDAYLGAVNQ